jgi:hypothetical protein
MNHRGPTWYLTQSERKRREARAILQGRPRTGPARKRKFEELTPEERKRFGITESA